MNPDTPDAPTDFYYAELTSNWDVDGDGKFGEWGDDFTSFPSPEVTVRRIPVYGHNYSNLDAILRKTIDYCTEVDGAWRKSMILPMAVAWYANEDGSGWQGNTGDALGQAIVGDLATPNGYSAYTLYEKDGLSPAPTACNAPLTEDNLFDEWAANPPGIVAWLGHGLPTGSYRKIWTADTNGNGYADSSEITWSKFIASSDVGRLDDAHPAIVIQASCLNGQPEVRTTSVIRSSGRAHTQQSPPPV